MTVAIDCTTAQSVAEITDMTTGRGEMPEYIVTSIVPVDLPELVRCKECKHRPIGGEAHKHTLIFPDEVCPCNCVDDNWYSWMPDDDWFCGNGER